MKHLARAIHPAEWVLLGFLGFALLCLAISGQIKVQTTWISFPRIEILSVFVLGLSFRMMKFRDSSESLGHCLIVETREFLPLILMICLYPLVPTLIDSLGMSDQDALITKIDRNLFFGKNPQEIFNRIIWAPLSEWMALAYTAYGFIFLFVVGMFLIRKDRTAFRDTVFSLCLAFALGYVGYILVPVKGPMFTQVFSVNLDLYYTRQIKETLMDHTRIQRDCFPSLHTAVTLILAAKCWQYARSVFWFLVPFVLSIPVACIYLRYHYVMDVLMGILLAGLVLLIPLKASKFGWLNIVD